MSPQHPSTPSEEVSQDSTPAPYAFRGRFLGTPLEYLVIIGLTLVLFPLARLADPVVMDFWNQPIKSGQTKGALRALKLWGEGTTVILMLVGWLCLQPKRAKVIGLLALAIGLAAVGVHAVKWTTGRARPGATLMMDPPLTHENPTWRGTDEHNSSFPSGHTATAFGLASGLARAYPVLTPVVLVAASGTAANRMYEKSHFISDCLVGACIGWLMPALFWSRRRDVWDERQG